METPTAARTAVLTPERESWYLGILLAGWLIVNLIVDVGLEWRSGPLDNLDKAKGRDFLHLYVSGRIAAQGDIHRLYDQAFFKEVQNGVTPITKHVLPYPSVYSPAAALVIAPLTRLPYELAVLVWWGVQIVGVVVGGILLWKDVAPVAPWRVTTAVALAAFTPVNFAVFDGQLVAVLLPVLVGGLHLHRAGRPVQAGMLLSLLALKPQLAAALVLWLCLRRDYRALAGLVVGGLVQVGLTAIFLGLEPWLDYVRNLPTFMPLLLGNYDYRPDYQHGVGGILINTLGKQAYGQLMLVHLAFVLGVSGLFVAILRRLGRHPGKEARRLEESAVLLFSVLVPPHFMIYDLTILLLPITQLWGCHRPAPLRAGLVLYLTGLLVQLFWPLGVSLVPLIVAAVLGWLFIEAGRAAPAVGAEGSPDATTAPISPTC